MDARRGSYPAPVPVTGTYHGYGRRVNDDNARILVRRQSEARNRPLAARRGYRRTIMGWETIAQPSSLCMGICPDGNRVQGSMGTVIMSLWSPLSFEQRTQRSLYPPRVDTCKIHGCDASSARRVRR